jgi:uncharacterized metal-binding protein
LSETTPRRPSTAGSKPHRRHLRNYLIDKSLQLRYVIVVTVISAVIAGGLGFLLNRQETFASDTIIQSMNDPGMLELLGSEGVNQVKDSLRAQDRSQLSIMLVMGVGLMVVLSGYLVLMTHKVAGPLYKIGLYFDRMRDGKLPKVWPLRKGDQLVDFFEQFRTMDEALRERTEAEIAILERFVTEAEKAGVPQAGELGHRVDELRALVRDKKESLL